MTANAASGGTLATNLVAFVRALRRAGIPVGVEETANLGRALESIDLGQRDQVFYAARALLVRRHEDLALFASLFDRFFRARFDLRAPRPPRPPARPKNRPLALADFMARRAGDDDPSVELDDRAGAWSATETLRRRDFADLEPEELERVQRLIPRLRLRVAERTTRRQRPERRGEAIDLRRTLAKLAKHGAVPARLPRRQRASKPRPLVLIADISGSMEKYARLVLLLFYCLAHSGKSAARRVESFVFGTRLTRITPALELRNVDRAVGEAAARVADWSGGTRIGDSLADFNRRWARRILRRGAVVVLVSDGCDRGAPGDLARAMRFLSHRAHRLVWLNPLLGDARYRPRTRGMSAALPFVDDFLPVHNLISLEQLAEHLETLPARRSARRQTSPMDQWTDTDSASAP